MLIRLRGCASWSASLLFANSIKQIFSWRGTVVYCLLIRVVIFNGHKIIKMHASWPSEVNYFQQMDKKKKTREYLNWKTKTKQKQKNSIIWAASSEFGSYRLCEQRRVRRACASAQSRQNLRCSLIQAVSQEEPSDRKPDPWSLWMAGHAQLIFVMTECSKTQIRLTGLLL